MNVFTVILIVLVAVAVGFYISRHRDQRKQNVQSIIDSLEKEKEEINNTLKVPGLRNQDIGKLVSRREEIEKILLKFNS